MKAKGRLEAGRALSELEVALVSCAAGFAGDKQYKAVMARLMKKANGE